MTKRALWHSPMLPDPEQFAGIQKLGFDLLYVKDGVIRGSRKLDTPSDVYSMHSELVNEVEVTGASAIFGIIPVPLRAWWHRNGVDGHSVRIYEPWSVPIPIAEGKPAFIHRSWELTMVL